MREDGKEYQPQFGEGRDLVLVTLRGIFGEEQLRGRVMSTQCSSENKILGGYYVELLEKSKMYYYRIGDVYYAKADQIR